MISNKYQKIIVIGLIILNVSYFTLALDNILYTMYFPSILTILVSFFIMISNKSKKVFGIGLIISGGMLFYNFFDIMILFLSKGDETFIDILPGMITHVLPEMWHFHYPGFALIISGILVIKFWKTKYPK